MDNIDDVTNEQIDDLYVDDFTPLLTEVNEKRLVKHNGSIGNTEQ